MPPKFSVIIPAHNEEDYIRKTLHSIKNQTFQDYEIIVVTNGCTDKTEEIVKKRVSDKIKHVSLNKANVSRARNYGASKADGDILVFLDADTTLEEEALQKINNSFLEEHSIATTKVKPDDEQFKYKVGMGFKNFYLSTNLYSGCSGALICRRKEFDKVNGYDASIIVKEHRKLILKLLEFGKFSCINTHVTTSMRRMKEWGLMGSTYFWLKQLVKDKVGGLEGSEYEKVR